MYFALKSKGMVQSKEEFWLGMDTEDLSQAGAFVPREIWDNFILKQDKTKITIKPKDYTRR